MCECFCFHSEISYGRSVCVLIWCFLVRQEVWLLLFACDYRLGYIQHSVLNDTHSNLCYGNIISRRCAEGNNTANGGGGSLKDAHLITVSKQIRKDAWTKPSMHSNSYEIHAIRTALLQHHTHSTIPISSILSLSLGYSHNITKWLYRLIHIFPPSLSSSSSRVFL